MKIVWCALICLIVIIFGLQITLFIREREHYEDTTPLRFREQLPSYSRAGAPYMGNTWPNSRAEPWSEQRTRQGTAIKKREEKLVNCVEAWRDCHANQNCSKTLDADGDIIRSTCIPKPQAYYPKWLGKY